MSFKREGNDSNLLGSLQKRRIRELLSEDIPEDEAKLLCNGRFACLVCPSNPVFDTVAMLSVHRKGKKHMFNLEIHEAKKRELKQLIAKRRHEQFSKDGTTSIKMAVQEHKGILTSTPYDPCVKKGKGRRGERRPILDLNAESETGDTFSKSIDYSTGIPSASNVKDLPGSSSHWHEICEQQISGPIRHTHQLKNIFQGKAELPVRVTPYQSKNRKAQSTVANKDGSSCGASSHSYQAGSGVNKQNNSLSTPTVSNQNQLSAYKGFQTRNSSPFTNKTIPVQMPHGHASALPPAFTSVEACPQGSQLIPNLSWQLTSYAAPPPPPPPPPDSSRGKGTQYGSNHTSNCNQNQIDEERRKAAEDQRLVIQKLRQLQGSGWKRDWDGKWIKDENAEFDSDEEPPDIP